jgi:hypothetical protein
LQIAFINGNNKVMKTIDIKNKITQIETPIPMVPTELIIDPDVDLLFQGNLQHISDHINQ